MMLYPSRVRARGDKHWLSQWACNFSERSQRRGKRQRHRYLQEITAFDASHGGNATPCRNLLARQRVTSIILKLQIARTPPLIESFELHGSRATRKAEGCVMRRRRGACHRVDSLLVWIIGSWGIWRLGVGVVIEVAIEPVNLPFEAFDQMLGLAGASKVVVLSGKEH
jgi:hypothetical protein